MLLQRNGLLEQALIGCLVGTAVGDALGLPYEGMSGQRGKALFPRSDRHHLLFGHGMVSDDTEHACIIAQAVIRSQADPERFQTSLAWSLRWWLLGLPAGIGLATLRSIVRLWLGMPPQRSGVFSAGNGPAMRSPVLGVAFGSSPEKLKDMVLRATRITHSDPKAYFGSVALAVAAAVSSRDRSTTPGEFLHMLRLFLSEPEAGECLQFVEKACASAAAGEGVAVFAGKIGSPKGISGYVYHTMPCIIQTWLRYQNDYSGGIREIIEAGGDTDTCAAILGGIIGAKVGKEGIPEPWRAGIAEWPRSVAWMESLAGALAGSLEGDPAGRAPWYFVPGIVLRNLFFTGVVLLHGLRRLLPPYR